MSRRDPIPGAQLCERALRSRNTRRKVGQVERLLRRVTDLALAGVLQNRCGSKVTIWVYDIERRRLLGLLFTCKSYGHRSGHSTQEGDPRCVPRSRSISRSAVRAAPHVEEIQPRMARTDRAFAGYPASICTHTRNTRERCRSVFHRVFFGSSEIAQTPWGVLASAHNRFARAQPTS